MGEEHGLVADAEFVQMQPQVAAAADGGELAEERAGDAQQSPGVPGAAGFQPLQVLHAAHGEQLGGVDEQVDLQGRGLPRRVAAVIRCDGLPEGGDVLFFDGQARGQGVAAEALQVLGAAGQGLEQVEAAAAAAGALAIDGAIVITV